MRDASFRSAGYALMIENNPDHKIQSTRETYAPWRFARKISPLRNSKCQYTRKKFWQFTWHFSSWNTFCQKQQSQQIFWQTTGPSHVFSKQRHFRQHFWNINFKIAHIAVSVNTAAFFLSRLELKVTENICLKIREDILTTPIEVTTSPSDVGDEEQFFFTQADNNDESE